MTLENLKHIENGSRAQRLFSNSEYQRRQHNLQQALEQLGANSALLTSIHNINYYSGFLYCAFGRPYGLTATPDSITTISANIDGGQPWRQSNENNIVYTDWQQDNFFQAVKKLLPNNGVIGVEYDHLSIDNLNKLKHALPQASFIDVSKILMKQRMLKSNEEIQHIKQGAQICDIGGYALRDAVQDNAPEYEVALHSTQTMVREIAKRFPNAELMDTWTWFQSGINTDGAHNPVTSRQVQKGDILSLNCFSMVGGYYTALERTLFFSHIDDESLRLWNINVEVHKAGLNLIRPGARCCDIAKELNKIYDNYGLLPNRTFGYGHSFGVLCHYYGREAGLELREDVETVLQPGMVVSMEPMIMIPEGQPGAGGYREHDILVIAEDGVENITAFPFGPEHNVIRR